MVTEIVDLDLGSNSSFKIVTMEGDICSRFIEFHLNYNGEVFDLQNKSVKCRYVNGRTTEEVNLVINDRVNGVCTLEIPYRITSSAQNGKCELVISQSGEILSTISFGVEVVKSLVERATVESSNEFGALTNALWKIDGVNAELNNINSQLDTIENEKATKQELEVVNNRISEIVANKGDGTKDSEIVDSRVGVNGEIYVSLGDSIRNQIKAITDYEYFTYPVAYYSGALNNSGVNSSATVNMNTCTRTTFIKMNKGDYISIKGYCAMVFEFDSNYTFSKYTRYTTDTVIKFTEDKIIRFYLYKSDNSNTNSETSVGAFVTLEKQKEIDSNVIIKKVIDLNKFYYGRYVDGRIALTSANTVFVMPRKLKANTSIYVDSDFTINLGKIENNIITSTYGFTGISLVKVNKESKNMFFIQKSDASVITSTDLENINLKLYENYKNKFNDGITKLIYHRGFSSMRAENTISSYEYVGQYSGKFAECDLGQTSDGEIILMHDDTVDRTTNGTGNVSDLSLTQIKELYIDAPMFVNLYNNTLRVPTLKEFLICCRRNNITPVMEMKILVNYQNLINLIIDYGFENNCIIVSGDIEHLKNLRKLNKNIHLGLFASSYSSTILNNVTKLGVNSGILFELSVLTENYLKRFRDLNCFVGAYVTDDYNDLEKFTNWGVDFIMTNRLLNMNNDLSNFKVENLYYSAEGTNIEFTIPYNETSLFADVIEVIGQVYYETNAPVLTVGDKTLTMTNAKDWNYFDLRFIQKVSGNITIKLESSDPTFKHILFKVRRYCGDLI